MKPFDNYEISPCTRTEETDRPGHFYFEVCEPGTRPTSGRSTATSPARV